MFTITTHYSKPYSARVSPAPLAVEPLRQLLLASSGDDRTDGALRLARALGERDGASVTLLSVVEPLRYMIPNGVDAMAALPTPEMKRIAESRRRIEIAEQLARTDAALTRWPVMVAEGAPASVIAQTAAELGADIVLTGSEQHGPVSRLLHGETALNVVRGGETPVLLVPATTSTIPRTVLVGMDFSNSALHAAWTAMRMIGPTGTLLLAHVQPTSYTLTEERDWRSLYRQGVDAAFERVSAKLGEDSNIAIQTVRLEGDPARALLDLATREEADMLAVGARGHTFLQRFLLGSVATSLVRESSRTVLISPRASITRAPR